MNIITIFFIAFALAADAFAVSVASGVIIDRNRFKKALQFGFMFGAFQMIMPVLGWTAGRAFHSFISEIDHWVAFILLSFIGAKMIFEAFSIDDIESTPSDMTWITLLALSLATSIDALAVGISFAFLKVSIILPVIIIGVITFFMSLSGVFLGGRLKGALEKKSELAGGIILIIIGSKILLEHILK